MRKKIVLWGMGEDGRRFLVEQMSFFSKWYRVICAIDHDEKLHGKLFSDCLVLPPKYLTDLTYDFVCISSMRFADEIHHELNAVYHVPDEKIITLHDVAEKLIETLAIKYQYTKDTDIQDTLDYYKKHGFNIYGNFHEDTGLQRIFRDAEDWPYLPFFGERMYFPKNHYFIQRNGEEYVKNVMREQGAGSPHSYFQQVEQAAFEVGNGVLVDAGVCEGNFALRFARQAKKIYLIEADKAWAEALRRSFLPYADKTVICSKFLTSFDSASTITLDSLVQEPISFLKMDIEGAELAALLGGKCILQESNARCAVCSYHRRGDEANIRFILESLGYHTKTSHGYMFFPYDKHSWETLDFRRGVVYGER